MTWTGMGGALAWPRLVRRRSGPRVLGHDELPAAMELAQRAGPQGVLAGARMSETTSVWGEVWGFGEPGELRSICWFGGTLIPVGVDSEDIPALVTRARGRGRGCASIVGDAQTVLELWRGLESYWPQARTVRRDQPLLEITGPPKVEPDRLVRRATPAELPAVLPAAIAMFTEELGFSPLRDGPGYRHRVADLLAHALTYVRFDEASPEPRVEFKADLGAAIGGNAQIHGVWVDPRHRGHHVARHGVAAVVADALERGFTSISLYVNSHNTAALAAYQAVGFRQIGTWATVMF
ncbi:MAG: GNAT family N-acetyltransferase [Bifidobacteriaceae bacterium]|jgi:predicted GNAT family acetyltransferase|nr:GNAT family N-acetyltransferase [Bifidobacteriaceae bacterium]